MVDELKFEECTDEKHVKVIHPDGRVTYEQLGRKPSQAVRQETISGIYQRGIAEARKHPSLLVPYDPAHRYRTLDANLGIVFTPPADEARGIAAGWPQGKTELLLLSVYRQKLCCLSSDGNYYKLPHAGDDKRFRGRSERLEHLVNE
jgi:hypothetical protein